MSGQQEGRDRSLARVDIFRDLDAAERRKVEERCRWRTYAPHETVIAREQDTHEVHFVVWGRVRVLDYAASGREVAFDDIGPGGTVGELAAIDGGTRSASVVAVQRTLTASLDQRTFLNVLADHPEAGLATMRRLTRMVRQASERIMDLSALGANNRVHAEILRLAREASGPEAETARLSPIPVHSEVASRVSTTRETVARVFSDLTREGILRKERNVLVVEDVPTLAEMVASVRGG